MNHSGTRAEEGKTLVRIIPIILILLDILVMMRMRIILIIRVMAIVLPTKTVNNTISSNHTTGVMRKMKKRRSRTRIILRTTRILLIILVMAILRTKSINSTMQKWRLGGVHSIGIMRKVRRRKWTMRIGGDSPGRKSRGNKRRI